MNALRPKDLSLPDDPKLRVKAIRDRCLAKARVDPERWARYKAQRDDYRRKWSTKAKDDPQKWGRVKASHKAYRDRMKHDPEWRAANAAMMRDYRRSHPKPKERKIPTLNPPPEQPPIMQPINVREFKKPMQRRGRPRKPKKTAAHVAISAARVAMLSCLHTQGFTFTKLENGLKRTCKACGRSFTEIAKPS